MKYEGEKPTGEDKDFTAYIFSFRKQEVELLYNVLSWVVQISPKLTETQIVRSRLSNMKKVLFKMLEPRTVPVVQRQNSALWKR